MFSKPKKSEPQLNSPFSRLGVLGLGSIESILLAALTTAEPLLLIGPHGTGKSYLLNRVAEALGLKSRHYNASLLNFDDLVGYPIPSANGALEYVRTPSAIWGAQAVFFDEISRCRPDMQNKLFPIVHERRVQGIELNDLVYRWAAMNPPRVDDDDPYAGSEPLDIALADRFALVVEMPQWESFSVAEQEAVIRSSGTSISAEDCAAFGELLQRCRQLWAAVRNESSVQLAIYVRVLIALLGRGGITLSPRRAGMILRNISAVHAAALTLKSEAKLEQSALDAVLHSFPQRAWGGAVEELKVIAAHREAWHAAQVEDTDPLRCAVLESDPLRRLALAAAAPSIPSPEYSTIVSDVLASLPTGAQHAVAMELFSSGCSDRLLAAVADQCSTLASLAAIPQSVHQWVNGKDRRHVVWQEIVATLARLPEGDPETQFATNLLCGLFSADELATPANVSAVLGSWKKTRESFRLPKALGRKKRAS